MLLGLKDIIHRPGASLTFSESVDLSDLQFGTCYPVTEPVKAEGTVRNTADVLMMKGTITTCLHGVCDRCATEFDRQVEIPLDVDPECKGLCCGCGVNLNVDTCKCEKEVDPRLAALRQLLDK